MPSLGDTAETGSWLQNKGRERETLVSLVLTLAPEPWSSAHHWMNWDEEGLFLVYDTTPRFLLLSFSFIPGKLSLGPNFIVLGPSQSHRDRILEIRLTAWIGFQHQITWNTSDAAQQTHWVYPDIRDTPTVHLALSIPEQAQWRS